MRKSVFVVSMFAHPRGCAGVRDQEVRPHRSRSGERQGNVVGTSLEQTQERVRQNEARHQGRRSRAQAAASDAKNTASSAQTTANSANEAARAVGTRADAIEAARASSSSKSC